MKELFGTLAMFVTFALFVPYIHAIRRELIRPHVFSWVIWGLGTSVVGLAQLTAGGGAGAWVIGVSGLISCYVAWLAYSKRGDTVITTTDWQFLGAALCALPGWFFTANPLWAVVILTTVDLCGFGPTLRKAYHRPGEESAGFFALSGVRNGLVILALENYSLTTVLFPAAVGGACFAVAALLAFRKKIVAG